MSEFRTDMQGALDRTFTLERELYHGGPLRTFLATELASARRVVVRIIPADATTRPAIEAFVRDVRLLARLQHPNLVPIVGAGEGAGVLYYTMKYIDAPTLRERLASGPPMPLSESMHLLREAAKGLNYSHAHGVLHGDLRPDHILVTGGTALLTDVGIASVMSAAHLTMRDPLGHPAYLAPEQLTGGVGDLRADLYAWGVIAYELITGAHPFAERTTPPALTDAHARQAPAPIGRGNPSLPAALARVVMRCLEQEPDKRPLSAADLLVALDSAERPRATPVESMVAWESAPATRPSRRPRVWLAAALAAASIAAIAWLLLLLAR